MRLISCHVDNFGGLKNYDYDFEDGLNIILHDNGWGKTTLATFLKVMLYGFTSRNSKDITENERKRYLPWQGGTFGGYLDFEADGKRFRVHRSFGAQPRMDKTRIVDLDKSTTAKIDPDSLGEDLFHLDASAFQRSVFINQNGLSMDGSASSIHTRLNALVSQANDLAVYDDAIKKLTEQTKVYEKTGQRGLLGDVTRSIAEKERIRDRLEEDVIAQDDARARIQQIDALIAAIDKELAEKKEKLDKLSGDTKKAEASQKLLDDINVQIESLQEKINAVKSTIGEDIPSADEIEKVKEANKTVLSLSDQLKELSDLISKLNSEYEVLMDRYEQKLPTDAELDEIQSIYGELQGIKSTADEDKEENISVPVGYSKLLSASGKDKAFLKKLQEVIDSEDDIQKLLRKLTEEDSDAKHAEEAWAEKKNQFKEIKEEISGLEASVEGKEKFDKEKVQPSIDALEEIKKKQQLVELKSGELAACVLSTDEEAIIQKYGDNVPDIDKANDVLQKYRNVSRKTSEIDGLKAKLEGENSKADGIKASLAQYAGLSDADVRPAEGPGQPKGKALIGVGAGVAVLGVVAGIFFAPLFAVAAIGIVLAILGINNNKTYKAKLQKYEESKANAARNAENLQKKKELERQLQDVQNSISGLNKQIFDNENSIVSDNVAVSNWASKWIPGIEASESAISNTIDEARQYKSIIGKNNEIDEKKKFVEATKIEIEKSLRSVEDEYPEILGMSNDEVLKSLRTLENEYKTKKEQLEKAIAKKEKFLSELGLDEEAMSSDNAPKSDADKEALTTKEHLEKLINSDNEILERINLNIDAENFTEVLGKAEKWLIEFKQYNEKQQERGSRQNRKKQQISELQTKMDEKAVVLCKQYSDIELPDRLAKVREDITAARQLKKKLEERKSDKEKKDREFGIAKDLVDDFTERFDVDAKDQTVAIEIIAGNSVSYRDLLKQMNHLLEQKKPIEEELKKAVGGSVGSSEEEKLLRLDIKGLEEKRDGFRDEYQQKNDFIRQADASLERYPDIVAEIRKLYDEKQKAQSNLDTLKRTKALITKAKENLANRYLSKVEDMFNNYMHIWLNNDAVRGVLDIDFNVAIEEDGVEHLAQGYSTGYCDLIDFCMRLALVDTLFENEQPFLILDDPFVNLDTDRLDKALDLLDAMAASKQIVYFVCHPIRAVKTDGDSDARKKFAELAEATKKSMEERKTTVIAKKPVVKKLPRELYVVKNSKFKPAIQPAKPDYVITNSIFSMKLVADEMFTGDASYELFFIDAIGHVMNERQLVEVKAGKLSTDRVQFSLNTRDDSGDQYELMIRESGADDYEVLQRFPFKVKLAFAGTFSFDF